MQSMFAEDHAGLLLVAHAIVAAALVAASTHLVIWIRGLPKGRCNRIRAARRFAYITCILYALQLLIGNVLYPVYKVRVRMEYLEDPSAILRDLSAREEASRATADRVAELRAIGLGEPPPPPAAAPTDIELSRSLATAPRNAAKLARWFDVKEHWAALGFLLSLACAVLLSRYPRNNEAMPPPAIRWTIFAFACGACAVVWMSAIVGLVITSVRSVASL